MTSRVQTLRSSVAASRPATGTRAVGELYVNYPDNQLGVIDAALAARDLLVVRMFNTLASYVVGQYVWNAGLLYRATTAVAPGAFNPAQWAAITDASGGGGSYLPLTGGTLTGDLTIAEPTGNSSIIINKFASGNLAQLEGRTNTGVRWDVTLGDQTPESGANAGSDFSINAFADGTGQTALISTPIFIKRSTGQITVNATGGALTINGPTVANGASITLSINNKVRWGFGADGAPEVGGNNGSDFSLEAIADDGITALGAPILIDRASGQITVSGNTGHDPTLVLDKVAGGRETQLEGHTAGVRRWVMNLGDNLAETGGNAGSDFQLNRYTDGGAFIDTPLAIQRSSGLVQVFQDPVAPGGVATKHYVDTHVGGGGGIADAPSDGTAYARRSTAWAHLTHNDITDWGSPGAGYLLTSGGTMTGALTLSQTAGLIGTTTNNNANTGSVGEYLVVSQTTNVSLSSAVSKNITQITLPAGDWDVDGTILINFSISGTNAGAVLTTTSGIIPNTITPGWVEVDGQTLYGYTGPLGTARFSFSTATIVYLVAESGFGSGTCVAQGIIRARRVR